tara:strand:+ start:731 stop:1339 length:609 start_codon:yes stop_codon:yes gene_type:complete
MKRILGPALAGMLLVGCAATGPVWKATSSTDEFTDVNTRMVTVGEYAGGSLIVTKSLNYYPFVGIENGSPYVGIRSGGRYKIPTGTVQLRIDSNPAWTITPEETPVSLVPSLPTMQLNGIGQAVDMADLQKQALATATKMMSPYTVATGDKAKSILREMVRGKVLKYRTVGMNQAASTTGEVTLDVSFVQAIKSIGIDPAKL